jgi:uncharacterized protein involved in exopolysaccharide biosynthesis
MSDDGQDVQIPVPEEGPEPNPIASLFRAMRGRWPFVIAGAAVLAPVLAIGGYMAGAQLYESQAILRVFPQESNILYATGDGSVLKTFDSFVKAETTYVASHQVMARAAAALADKRPDIAGDLKVFELSRSIEIKRSDSLIVLKTRNQDPAFAREKLDAVVTAYLGLKSDAEEARSAVRLSELHDRETELIDRLSTLRSVKLEVGGEFGINAIAKAHVEKVSQMEALAARKSDIAATIGTLETSDGPVSADTSNQEIMRATLLDRAMADLSFERAKMLSELAGLRARFAENVPAVRFKLAETAVIEQAIADRRKQIQVLGQTGALTDVSAEATESSLAEIGKIYEKIGGQLDAARRDAKDLNRRRIELDWVGNELEGAQGLLKETRHALEVIRLESGRALPGYSVLMSPASQTTEPIDDSRKLLAAGGLGGGAFIALFLTLLIALRERRIRFSETLFPLEHRVPVLQVSADNASDPHAADFLRNELQLRPLRRPRLVGKAIVIAVTRAESGATSDLARALAKSYARSRMKTLFIEADLGPASVAESAAGWRDVLEGKTAAPNRTDTLETFWELSAGIANDLEDRTVSLPMVRGALGELLKCYDVIVVSAGSLRDCLACQFVLSAADVGILELCPSDRRKSVFGQIERLDDLPRHGSVAVMRNALPGDPLLAVKT